MVTKLLTKVGLFATVLCAAWPLMAADNPTNKVPVTAVNAQEMKAKHFDPHINAWAEGDVSSIDYERNTLKVHGKQLAIASLHAQMNKDLNDQVANADAAQREKIAADVKQTWKDRLDKARTAAANQPEKDFAFTFAADGKVKDHADLERQRTELKGQDAAQANQPELVGEIVIVDIYEVPANASDDQNKTTGKAADNLNSNKNQERPLATSSDSKSVASKLTLRDIKTGDKVMVGFAAGSDQAYLIVNENKTAAK